ncbi:MAG: PaaI family thioesterase [Actinobacteria bacterium]|jgi:acyl-coenzyme A thioesterase PaaI-like protein|nr:PaaI family thioesterase [Actinomycetota bacterium]
MGRIASTTPPDDAVMPVRHPKAPAAGSQIPSHFGYCFGCGQLHTTGLHFTAIAGNGLDLTGNFTVTKDHQGAPGLAHGGLLSLAFDEALGKLMWLIRTPAVTGRLETDFLLPVPMGRTLYIDAKITGQSGRKIYTQAEGRLDSITGEIAVKAAAIFISVPMEHFIKNLTEQYKDHLTEHPELMAFVDPDFDINP